MVDVFDEVEEQLRSDRYKTLALKALPWIGAATVAVVIGVGAYWGWTTHQARETAKASEAYQAALETLGRDGVAKGFPAMQAVAKDGASSYRALALMHMGGVRLDEGKTAEAVAYFDEAAKLTSDPVFGDLARLKSAFALMDTAPYKEIEARLTPLAGEKSPYRVKAKEALAFAKLQAGDAKGAREDFSVLSNLLDNASDDVRQRAQVAMQVIDSGGAPSLSAAVKASIALPPSPGLPAGPQLAPNGAQ